MSPATLPADVSMALEIVAEFYDLDLEDLVQLAHLQLPRKQAAVQKHMPAAVPAPAPAVSVKSKTSKTPETPETPETLETLETPDAPSLTCKAYVKSSVTCKRLPTGKCSGFCTTHFKMFEANRLKFGFAS